MSDREAYQSGYWWHQGFWRHKRRLDNLRSLQEYWRSQANDIRSAQFDADESLGHTRVAIAPQQVRTARQPVAATLNDGPGADGQSVVYRGVRYNCPKGQVYNLIALMWGREKASYDEVNQALDEPGLSRARIKDICSKASKILESAGIDWRISNRSSSDCIVRLSRQKS